MQTTTNYKLNKPDLTDKVRVQDLNANMDTLDKTVKDIADESKASADAVKVIQTTVSGYTSDINTLKSDSTQAKTDIQQLKTDVSDAQSDIGTLQTDVSSAQGNIQSLQTDVSGAKDDIAALQSNNTKNESDIAKLKEKDTEIEGNIDTVESNVSSVTQRVGQLEGQYKALNDTVTTAGNEIDSLQSDVEALQSDVSTNKTDITGLKTKDGQLESSISSIEKNVTTAQGDITTLKSDVSTAKRNITTLQSNVKTNTDKLAKITNPMIIKGTVASVSDLQNIASPEAGWIYFVGATGAKDFDEYVYTESSKWEKLGHVDIDLSKYATVDSVTSQLAGKADKTALSAYATTTDVDSKLSKKADASELTKYALTDTVNTELNKKANTTDLSVYAEATTVNTQLNSKADKTELANFVKNHPRENVDFNELLDPGFYGSSSDNSNGPSINHNYCNSIVVRAVNDADTLAQIVFPYLKNLNCFSIRWGATGDGPNKIPTNPWLYFHGSTSPNIPVLKKKTITGTTSGNGNLRLSTLTKGNAIVLAVTEVENINIASLVCSAYINGNGYWCAHIISDTSSYSVFKEQEMTIIVYYLEIPNDYEIPEATTASSDETEDDEGIAPQASYTNEESANYEE